MIAAVCVDDRGGMAFHGRRVSRDRLVRADLLSMAGERRLWMSAESRKQFTEPGGNLAVSEDFLARAGRGEFCFVEDRPLCPWREKLEALVLYRWNRMYPFDLRLDLDPAAEGWTLRERREFPGFSHQLITKEVYVP